MDNDFATLIMTQNKKIKKDNERNLQLLKRKKNRIMTGLKAKLLLSEMDSVTDYYLHREEIARTRREYNRFVNLAMNRRIWLYLKNRRDREKFKKIRLEEAEVKKEKLERLEKELLILKEDSNVKEVLLIDEQIKELEQ